MREMPMKKAGDILGESDTRLWRLLFKHVAEAHAALDLSGLVHLGVDEMNCRKGHNSLAVFADLVARTVEPRLPEGLSSVFNALKRKARSYRSLDYMIAMLYFVAGKLSIPSLAARQRTGVLERRDGCV